MQRFACIMFFSSLVLFCSINCKVKLNKQFNQKVVNGDFENGANGWTSNDIEVLPHSSYNQHWAANQGSVTELDAWKGNTEISQTVDLYHGTYTLVFLAAAREGVALESNKLIVLFNDVAVVTHTPTDYLIKKFKVVVNSILGKNSLKFKGDGTSDGLGITVDNISLKAKEIDFIVDGTFENDGAGWDSADKEVLPGSSYSQNWKTGKVTELDAWAGNTIMKQTFKVDVAATLAISFDYNARANIPLDSNEFSVYFNGKVIVHIKPTDYNNHNVKVYVNSVVGNNTIEFHGEGKSDGVGMTIDNVKVISYAHEMIINGGFEEGAKGWVTSDLEVGSGPVYTDFLKDNVSEMDAWAGNTALSQTFDSDDEEDYYISFDGAARRGIHVDSCQLQVTFNGVVIANIHPADHNLHRYIYYVKVKEGPNEIKLAGTGNNDTVGFILDNVSCRKRHEATGNEYITNGGFENGSTGWSSADLEIGNGAVYSNQMNTGNISELDAWAGNTTITNKVTIDVEGFYEIKFDGAARQNIPLPSNKADVLVEDNIILSVEPADYNKHTITVPLYLTVGDHNISLRGTGVNDGVGYLVDNISLKRLF